MEGRPEDNGFGLRIFAGSRIDAYLQRADRQRGYTVAIWRGPHVAEPTQLSAEDATTYWLEVLRVARVLERHYRPAKLNFMTLGNALPHLRTHVIPRYVDDPAPGRPLPSPTEELPPIPEDEFARGVLALRALLR